jgi:hypothetical protein
MMVMVMVVVVVVVVVMDLSSRDAGCFDNEAMLVLLLIDIVAMLLQLMSMIDEETLILQLST